MKAVTTFGIAIGIFLLPVGLRASEEQKDIPKEAREAMQYMIGDWEIEGHENNQPMKGHVTHRWAPGNHCLTWDMVLTSPKGTFQGTAVIAWDRTRRQLVERDFWSDGSANTYWYTVGRGRWSGESLQVGPDGAATKGKIAQENLGPAEFVWKHFDSVGPGGKPGGVSELRFRKVNALTYEHFLEYGEAMVGDWEANVLLTGGFPESGKKGDRVPGRFTITWTFDRKAFVGQGRIGDV